LLQNSRAILSKLVIKDAWLRDGWEDIFDRRSALRILESGLPGNTKLKELTGSFIVHFQWIGDEFDNLLCDSSSLESICNSNHTLEQIGFVRQILSLRPFSPRSLECLELNENENKNKVIQNKVIQYYFVGDSDMAPFARMPVSVLAEVMGVGVGGEMSDKQTSIFELLRRIPDLCNLSNRISVGPDNIMDTSCTNKRQKVDHEE
jgi:hypothetical protein